MSIRSAASACDVPTRSEPSFGPPSPIAKKLSSPGLGAGGSWRSIASRATSAIEVTGIERGAILTG
jgi:hypothetical protein